MPPLHADIVPILNERAADQVADQLDRMGADAGRGGAASFSRMFSDGLGGLRGIGADAGAQFSSGLRGGIDDAVSDFTRGFGAMGDTANAAYAGMSRGAGLVAAGVAGIGVAAVAAGKQLYDLGSTWDDIGDGIAIRTGKLGDDLDRITGMVRDLGAETAAPLESIGDIAGRVSQAMGLTGNDLREMTQRIADLNEMTGQQTDIRDLAKTFRVFDIEEGSAQLSALDSLLNASQATGASINELIQSMNTAGRSSTQFGLGFGETAGLLATFEEAGLDITRVAPALSVALRGFAEAGRAPQDALRETIAQIREFSDAGRDAEATALAADTFGRGYIDFLNAIKSGSLDVEATIAALKLLGPTIPQLREETADWTEEWTTLSNTLKVQLKPVADFTFSAINEYLIDSADGVRQLIDVVDTLGSTWERVTGATVLGPNGELLSVPGPAPGANPFAGQGAGPGAGLPTSLDDFLGLPAGSPGVSRPDAPAGQWWGPDMVPAPDNPRFGSQYDRDYTNGGGTRLPDAPVLPLQYRSTAGVDPSVAAAMNRQDEVEHAIAEKEARLNQLRSSNVATAEDIQKAENDLTKAENDSLRASQSLVDAQTRAAEQQYRQMDKLSTEISEFGAQIDDDFGASEGLAGIAENVTKFLFNLAFAPAMGALTAVRESNGFGPGEAGSGLMGALGASGALGSQYQAVPRWARDQYGASAMGPTALQPGMASSGGAYPGDAALLANVRAGDYVSQGGVGDLTQGIGDCTSTIEDLVNLLDGEPTAGRSMSTGNAAEWLASKGFVQGEGGPGDFRVGYNSGHMQATLPGGTNWNWGSQAAAEAGGVGGSQGAYDPALTERWYRPAGGGGGAIPAAGGGSYTAPDLVPATGPSANTSTALTPAAPGTRLPGVAGAAQAAAGDGTVIGPTGIPAAGGGGGSLLPGTGMPGSPLGLGLGGPSVSPSSFRGATPSRSVSGGRAWTQGLPESGGIGIGSGGLLGLAGSMASSAAGAAGMAAGMGMDGGAGGAVASAVAQMGIQQLQRAASAAGQYAGAIVGGIGETFSLNGSALGDPSASWLGRIAAVAPGVRASLPNTAGMLGGAQNPNMAEAGKEPPGAMEGPPGPLTPEQAAAGKAGQGGGTDNSTNDNSTSVHIHNPQTRDLDGSMRDVQTALGNSQAARQPR